MAEAADVQLFTFSDADFSRAFQWVINGVPFDFTNHGLMMMVRKLPDDTEVFVSLSTDDGDIVIYQTVPTEDGIPADIFNITITRAQMADMEPGDYVHSLILLRPDGLREDIFRGTLTHTHGPTR